MSENIYNATEDKLTRIAGGTLWADSPIGTILPYGGASAPSGWMLCQGQAISRTTYSELFAVIGESFGAGDGSTTFNLPDMREVVPVGAGTSSRNTITTHDAYNLGQFKDDQIQDHIHYAFTGRRNGWMQFAAATPQGVAIRSQGDDYDNAYSVGEAAQARIGTTTHGKQLGVNYIIKAKMVAVPSDFLAKAAENNEYSTTETVVGKWIDGKPIYRKVFHYDSITTSGDYLVENNVEHIVNQGGCQTYSNAETFTFPWIYQGALGVERLYFVIKNNDLYRRVEYNNMAQLSDINWWVEYTKTTD